MYQPYPASGQPSMAGPPQPPESILKAVRFMYIGAGLGGLTLIIDILVNAATQASSVSGIIGALIGIGLWLWMAAANKAGKSYARILSTVFFGLGCIGLIFTLIVTIVALGLVSGGWATLLVLALLINAGVVVVGLLAMLLLWRPESGAYYNAISNPGAIGGQSPYAG
jgi:hypothetical protein